MIDVFKLSEKEKERAIEFEKAHRHPSVNKGAIGGHISYTFTPTSLGNGVEIKCSICGHKQNITDYDIW